MPSASTLVSSFILAAIAAMALVLWVSQGEANEDGLLIAVFPPTASEFQIMRAVVASDGVYVRASLPETIVAGLRQPAARRGRVAHLRPVPLRSRACRLPGACHRAVRTGFGRHVGGTCGGSRCTMTS